MTCLACAEPTTNQIEVAHHGEIVAAGALCLPCRDLADRELAQLRAELDALLAQGVHRRMADRIMCLRVDGIFAERARAANAVTPEI